MDVLTLLVQREFRMHMAESNALAVKHISSTVHAIKPLEAIVEVVVSLMVMAPLLMISSESSVVRVSFVFIPITQIRCLLIQNPFLKY